MRTSYRDNRTSLKKNYIYDDSISSKWISIYDSVLLRDFGAEHVNNLYTRTQHLAPKTQGNIVGLLISMFRYAKELGWLIELPAIRRPFVVHDPNNFKYLATIDEVLVLLEAALKRSELHYVFYAVAALTGCRAGEVAGLRWEDIDFVRRLITVQRSYDSTTKPGKTRFVPIFDILLPILKEWPNKIQWTLFSQTLVGTFFLRARGYSKNTSMNAWSLLAFPGSDFTICGIRLHLNG